MYRRFLTVLVLVGAGALHAMAQSSAPSNTYVFPMFVDGTTGSGTTAVSYRSVLRINNIAGTASSPSNPASPIQCILNQINTSASMTGVEAGGTSYPANVTQAGYSPVSTIQINLTPSPFEILRTSGQAPLKTGYAKLSCPSPVDAQVQFALYDATNTKLGEAAVAPATAGNSFQFEIDRRDGTRLGFSLANDSSTGGLYGVVARDQTNNIVAYAYYNIQPGSQVSEFVDEALALPSNFVGTIEIVGVPGSTSYVIGLQFTGRVFSTVNPVVRSKPIGS